MVESTTKDMILAEARTSFANRGFAGTSLNDIASGVGIKRPSLLHYFQSKDALYREVLTAALDEWAEKTEAACSAPLDGWELVDSALSASFEFFKSNPEVIKIVRREALNADSEADLDIGIALRPYFDRAVSFFEREMDAGRFKRHDPENLVISGYGALLSFFSDNKMLEGLLNSDPMTEDYLKARFAHVRDFFLAALEP